MALARFSPKNIRRRNRRWGSMQGLNRHPAQEGLTVGCYGKVGNTSHSRTGAHYGHGSLEGNQDPGKLFERIQYRVTGLGSQQEAGGSSAVSLRFIEAQSSRSGYEDMHAYSKQEVDQNSSSLREGCFPNRSRLLLSLAVGCMGL